MKYIFNLCNIICLTATMFIVVETLYSYIDASLSDNLFKNSNLNFQSNLKSPKQNSQNEAKLNGKQPIQLGQNHYDIIYKRDIFKTDGGSDIDDDKKNDDAISEKELELLDKTELKLTLWGTATGGSDLENYAVIESNKDKRQELYKKGDKIEDAVIKKILRFSVILSRDGKDELLEISKESLSKKGSGSNSANISNTTPSSAVGDDKIEVSVKRSLVDESMGDINSLMSQMRARPHFTGGNPDGILLYGIKQDSIFKEMGIQNGDIIMGVDGKEINSVDDAISLYDKLKNSSEMKMQIRRHGQIKEILYNVE
ncbi:MAG: PDZ domain-containing protein [Desulfamplus sp.]|nr:PDZ domain-containing protein [Desulfamplus sp.]